MIHKVINLLMALFFMYATYVNLNDHDWYLWAPIYSITCALTTYTVFEKPDKYMNQVFWLNTTLTQAAVCVLYSIYTVCTLYTSAAARGEKLRELGGLLVILTWISFTTFTTSSRFVSSKSSIDLSKFSPALGLFVVFSFVPLISWSACFIDNLNELLTYC